MASEPGTRIRKTVETEVLPPASQSSDARPSEWYDRDWWELMADISRQRLWLSQSTNGHQVRIYRADDGWRQTSSPPENKFTEFFNEETIRSKWGGGRYILWLYGPPDGSKVVARPYRLDLEGPQKTPAIAFPAGGGGVEQLVAVMAEQQRQLIEELRQARGGNLTADAMKNALEIQAMGMKSAIQMQMPVQGPLQQSRLDKVLDELIAALVPAMLKKFTDPTDPIESLGKVVEAVKGVSGLLGGGKGDKPDTLGTIVNALPSVLDKAMGGLREIRLAAEAQERAARIQQGRILEVQPTAPGTESASSTQIAEPPSTVPPPQQLTPEQLKEIEDAVFLKRIMEKIVTAIETDPQCSGESLYDFLQNTAPEIIPQLKAGTREQIIEYFRRDSILSRVAEHPKLPQIIDEFLAIAKES